jgi:hypothetical protein
MGDHPNIFMTYQWDLMGCFLLRAWKIGPKMPRVKSTEVMIPSEMWKKWMKNQRK